MTEAEAIVWIQSEKFNVDLKRIVRELWDKYYPPKKIDYVFAILNDIKYHAEYKLWFKTINEIDIYGETPHDVMKDIEKKYKNEYNFIIGRFIYSRREKYLKYMGSLKTENIRLNLTNDYCI